MEDTPSVHQEIEKEADDSIEMENNNITNQEIDREDDPLFKSIEEMLKELSPLSSQCCIYRVPRRLRELNEKVYTPQLVSIGPFHHGDKRLKNMEEYKLRHLKAFLHRTGLGLGRYLEIVKEWEQRARECYAESIELSSNEFIKMILVDGSFIVEFLLREADDAGIFDKTQMSERVSDDMMLLENQLPFFVLDGFFNSISLKESSILELVHKSFSNFSELSNLPHNFSSHEIKHIVDLMRCLYLFSIPKEQPSCCYLPTIQEAQYKVNARLKCSPCMTKHLVDFICRCYRFLFPKVQQKHKARYEPPPTVTELHEAGIKFKKGKSECLFDIKFTNGILEIPQLSINDGTGSWFQNLIAFEQCHGIYDRILSDYFVLLDGLINTSKDVDLLIRYKIIRSGLRSSEEATTLLQNIPKEVIIYPNNFYFSGLCQELNAYCKSPRHTWMAIIRRDWMATLKRDYLTTPWAGLSTIGAVILLVLTSIQTICSIMSL